MQTQVKPSETELVNFQTAIKGINEGKRARRQSWGPNDYMTIRAIGSKHMYIRHVVKANGTSDKQTMLVDTDTQTTDWFVY